MKYFIPVALILCQSFCKEVPPQIIKGEKKKEPEQIYHHSQAVARSGLRIREKPNLQAKKVTLVPYRKSGQILEIGKKVEKIDGRKGYWAKVKFKEFEGWIFTGYALLSDEPLNDSDNDDTFDFEYKVETVKRNHDAEDWVEKKRRSMGIFAGIELLEIKNSEQIDLKLAGNIFFKGPNGLQTFQTGGYEIIEKRGFPRPNALITGSVDCIACCATYESASRMYLVGKASIKVLHLKFIDQKAQCRSGEYDEEDTRFDIQNRWSSDGSTLYHLVRRPHCDIYDKDGFLIDSEPAKKRFAVIRFTDDNIEIETHPNSDVPEKYKQTWESGELTKMTIKP